VVVDWHECSALKTPFDDSYFDLIADRGCFHHISWRPRRQYAEEIARILRPGGVLFLRGSREADGPFFPLIGFHYPKALTPNGSKSDLIFRSFTPSTPAALALQQLRLFVAI
jgi:SAM-dependent methyltransferase